MYWSPYAHAFFSIHKANFVRTAHFYRAKLGFEPHSQCTRARRSPFRSAMRKQEAKLMQRLALYSDVIHSGWSQTNCRQGKYRKTRDRKQNRFESSQKQSFCLTDYFVFIQDQKSHHLAIWKLTPSLETILSSPVQDTSFIESSKKMVEG